MDRKKKRGMLGALTLTFGLMLAGCGTDNGNSSESAQTQAAEAEPKSAAQSGETGRASTRAFDTAKGTVQIPDRPQRIVTDYYGGELIAAGLNVVGAAPLTFDNPFLKERLQDAEDAGQPLNTEKILELQPDLIVVMYDDSYEALSKIAPTVHIPFNTAKSVTETIALFSELAGRPDDAKTLIDSFEQKGQTAREALKSIVDERATIGIYELVNDGTLWIFGENAGRGGQVFYNALGYRMPHPDPTGEQTLQLSMEMLPEYAADYMFLTVYDPDHTGEALRDLQELEIWKQLPAVRNNRVFINDYDYWYPNDPLAVMGQIDLAVDALTQREAENAK
ncbi:ABC transporter substrate-binding protein [Cohnella cellulosilytica]|uniref:ABC transporter substrate-binding protein n=1 Tax=Cohnella cellulosilytica TaxID=986710 RepID=A0ABW2FFH3_9BACL